MNFRDARDIVAAPAPAYPRQIPDAVRDAGLHVTTWVGANAPMLYFSPLRPYYGLRVPELTTILERWGVSSNPLPPDVILKFELQPVGAARAYFLFDASSLLRRPIELTDVAMPDDGFRAAALFLNPRQQWQLSHFVDCVGPTGHDEGDDPIELLERGLGTYRFWNPGAVDALVERLAECG